MERKQKNFLIVITTLVVLFTLVMVLTSKNRQAVPEPLSTPTGSPVLGFTLTPDKRITQTTGPDITATDAGHAAPEVQSTSSAPAGPRLAETPTLASETQNTTAAQPVVTFNLSGREFFVSPDGRPENDGSQKNPWPLQYVLDQPDTVKPGDLIWVMGGRYTGPFESRLQGTEDKPIIIRAVPGERVILESSDVVIDVINTRYTVFWGLEVSSPPFVRDPNSRYEGIYGIRIHQGRTDDSHNVKFVNLIIHDIAGQGFGWWFTDKNSELYGSLIFYNGVTQLEHGVYLNNQKGEKHLVDNIIFDNASHGIHAYGEKDYQQLNNLYLEGNTVFNNGSIGYSTTLRTWGIYKRNILVGGYTVAENPVIVDNYTYYPGVVGESINLGYRAGTLNAVVENNYFAGGLLQLAGQNNGLSMLKNTVLGFTLPELLLRDNDLMLNRPSDNRIFVRPNRYEPGRANITIYNWSRQSTITLTAEDLKGVDLQKGDQYQLRNVQDYFSDILTGIYDGEKIEIPMTNHTVAQPVGLNFKPGSTFPEFGAFVLLPDPESP